MAGIYIHIPFCKQICDYCDFHKSASLKLKDEMVKALMTEIRLRKNYIPDDSIETIYFGGGTPSLLNHKEITQVLDVIFDSMAVMSDTEITLEANPEDLTIKYLNKLAKTPVNRISIGCQSFFDKDLKLLKRRHNAKQSYNSVIMAKDTGFSNISIDLIYGIPGMTEESFEINIEKTFELEIRHISAYHLTIEPKTMFFNLLRKGKFKEITENESYKQYKKLIKLTKENDFIQYEISNFAKTGFYSKHNSNYWNQSKYLGIGPSAHSFNITSRQWNIANNKEYLEKIKNGLIPSIKETLDVNTRYNDYVLTSLRTIWGIDLEYIEQNFSEESGKYCENMAKKYISSGLIEKKDKKLVLSEKGKFIADNIISELLFI